LFEVGPGPLREAAGFRVGLFFKRRFAFGKFDEEAFAIHTAPAEAGQGLDKAHERLRLFLEGLDESGGLEPGEDLADAQSSDLLGGLVDLAVFVFADEVEKELELGPGIFTALLFGQPEGVAGLFPSGEIAFVQRFAGVAEFLNDAGIGDTLAEHLVDGFANLGRKVADLVSRETGKGGEVAGDG
jgi:hypothetical protein